MGVYIFGKMKKFGIPKKEHLTLQNEISLIIKKGKRISGKYLRLFFLKNKKPYSQFAVIINKKYGRSVYRNKAKRHIREIYRLHKNQFRPGYAMVFYIKNEFKNIKFNKKEELVLQMMEKAELLTDK